jgi:hypothetical protein
MSRIAELIEQMAVLPPKEAKANRLGDMIAIRDKLRVSGDEADKLRRLTSALQLVEGADFVSRAKQGLESASTVALKLKSRMDGGEGFERARADAVLTSINEKLGQASTGVTKGWRSLGDDQAGRFAPLAEAAAQASLPGVAGLKSAISGLQNCRENPPASPKEASDYAMKAASISAAISQLGLQGRAGQFMIDASKGQAKAKDLQLVEVLAFLDANPAIWSMLKVAI